MTPAPVIEIEGLVKRYGERTAVDGLDLVLREGEIFGLLGPNGAGKTTTILALLGLTEPTEGRLRVAGCDPTRDPLGVKRLVGYLPDSVGFYEDMTGRENLRYTARLNGVEPGEAEGRIDSLLDRVGLGDAADRAVREYSRGMRQRLGLADILVKRPRIAILDEPTLGIDPEGVREVLEFITRLRREEGLTVLLSSHLLYQVQAICDRVGIFVAGRLLACGPIADLSAQLARQDPYVIEVEAEPGGEELAERLRRLPGVNSVEPEGRRLLLHCREDVRGRCAREVVEAGHSLAHLSLRAFGLADIYRRYFQGGPADGTVPGVPAATGGVVE